MNADLACQAIYLHSTDDQLAATGKKSNIRYSELFSQYKQVIIRGIVEGKQKWMDLMAWYNAEVFGASDSETGTEGDVSRIEEALDDDGDDGDDGDGDGDDNDSNVLNWSGISYLDNWPSYEFVPVNDEPEGILGGEHQPVLVRKLSHLRNA